VGGIPEVVRDGIDGFLVPPDDPQALAAKLNKVLSDAALRQKLRTNAREGFLSRLELHRAVQEQADWLEGLLPDGQPSSAMASRNETTSSKPRAMHGRSPMVADCE
jgi:hypothetical protein